MTEDSLRLRVRVDAPAATVFHALTDTDALTDWFAESADVRLGEGRYEFWGRYAPQGDRPRQQLVVAEPAETLRFTWEFEDTPPSLVDLAIRPWRPGATTGPGGTGTGGPDGEDGSVVTLLHAGLPADGPADRTALHCFWYVSLANLTAHCAGLQTMPPFDFSVPAQGDALVRTVVDAPTEEVFAALLDPVLVDRWAGGKAVIEPTVGGRYDFGWDHGPGQVLQLERDRVLAYSWRYPGSPDTVVRWSLRDSHGSTYLTLVHSGFADDRLAEQFRQGWPGFLVEIKRLLELRERWQPIKI